MIKICIFAGTSEGRKLIEFLSTQPVKVTAVVATEYGSELIPESENVKVLAGRMPVDEIKELLKKEGFNLVIDATHPYAVSITDSIIEACSECKAERIRVLRDKSETQEEMVWAENTDEAVKILSESEGRILLTTGSKELGRYFAIPDFAERVYARVLPMENSLELCRKAGLKTSHIIAMQGPFSREINTAMLKFADASWMVTKDGGDAGGFEDKLLAARDGGAKLLVIGRPEQRAGISLGQTMKILCSNYGCRRKPSVTIAGIGPGSLDCQTIEVRKAVQKAECIIGAARMNEAVKGWKQPAFNAIAPDDIAAVIDQHTEFNDFAIVMSGDSGFFSGTKKLLERLRECHVKVLPGLSSMSVLCARLKTSYEDVKAVSLHGRDVDIAPFVKQYHRVFTLVGGNDGINRLCRRLCEEGMQEARVSVGERLSYPDEKITQGSAFELVNGNFQSLSAALIEWKREEVCEESKTASVVTHGIPDSSFKRGDGPDGVVPMTKREIRSVAISMLELTADSVCWDVGAGTGSVAIEMALQAKDGKVYAVERKDEAADLIEVNKKLLKVRNVEVVRGLAPSALKELPAPSHVFVGGSSGSMKEIISLALEKNAGVRIVATAIALESVAELTSCVKEFGFSASEIISINAARNKKAGSYNLMTGQNPVYIFALSK